MNAIEFLLKEHNKIRTMLADISDESHQFSTKKNRFKLLAKELILHENMEHTIWYPHFKEKLPDTVKHLINEEKNAEQGIKKIEALKTESEWLEHFPKFKLEVEHHAEEEEKNLFPEIEKMLPKQQLVGIGAEMLQYKREHAE